MRLEPLLLSRPSTLKEPHAHADPDARCAERSVPAPPVRGMKAGIYRGQADAEFGLWRLRPDGTWLFCMPVAGATWKRAADQNPGDKLILLVDETRI